VSSHLKLAFLGRPSSAVAQSWQRSWPGSRVVFNPVVAPSGLRLGRRSLGLGVDAMVLASWLRVQPARHQAVLAMNPWTAVACLKVGLSDVGCTGLYALPGSASWIRLRAALGNRPVVTTSESECEAWKAEGGRAVATQWGGTFNIARAEPPTDGAPVRLFVGGSSDRDANAVQRLATQVKDSRGACELHVADGTGAVGGETVGGIRRYPRLSTHEFHQLMSSCHAAVLPLRERQRAAGHMVFVAALQAGLPVAVTPNIGMDAYIERLPAGVPVAYGELDLEVIMRLARATRGARSKLVSAWEDNYSAEKFAARVRSSFADLDWSPAQD
jgi:hypothetical protein